MSETQFCFSPSSLIKMTGLNKHLFVLQFQSGGEAAKSKQFAATAPAVSVSSHQPAFRHQQNDCPEPGSLHRPNPSSPKQQKSRNGCCRQGQTPWMGFP